MSRRVNFLDTETTGVNEPEQRIIEYCGSIYDIDTRQKIQTYTWRMNPERKIEAKAQKVHGISLADLANEPTIEKIGHLIRGTIEPMYMCVAHNGDDFDFPFLTRELRRAGHATQFPKTFDTMVNARWATHNGKNPRLGELAACLDVDYDPAKAHAAEYDVDVMAQCFFRGVDLGFFEIP